MHWFSSRIPALRAHYHLLGVSLRGFLAEHGDVDSAPPLEALELLAEQVDWTSAGTDSAIEMRFDILPESNRLTLEGIRLVIERPTGKRLAPFVAEHRRFSDGGCSLVLVFPTS